QGRTGSARGGDGRNEHFRSVRRRLLVATKDDDTILHGATVSGVEHGRAPMGRGDRSVRDYTSGRLCAAFLSRPISRENTILDISSLCAIMTLVAACIPARGRRRGSWQFFAVLDFSTSCVREAHGDSSKGIATVDSPCLVGFYGRLSVAGATRSL